jgi:GNAT superfamily N-acetyltransferase
MQDIAIRPIYDCSNVGGGATMMSPTNHGYQRDVEEGRLDIIGRGGVVNGEDDGLCDVIASGECDDVNRDETDPLLGGIVPLHTRNDDGRPHNILGDDKTISFREIRPGDRKRIQELFEEWFPVDYKVEFYDNLCNQRTMGDQKLYTLLATVPKPASIITSTITPTSEGEAESSHEHDDDGQRIIACLLGCKLSARKLNEASRTLLVPAYHPTSNSRGNNNINNNTAELDQTIEDLDASGDPNACTANNSDSNSDSNDDDDENDDDNESIDRMEVFYIMTLGVIQEYRKRGLASFLVERALQEQIVVAWDDDDYDRGCDGGELKAKNSSSDDTIYEEFEAAEIYQKPNAAETTRTAMNSPFDTTTSNNSSNNSFSNDDAKQRHYCETAYLHVIIQNQAAIRFYEKLGFSRLREIADYYTIDEKKHNCYLYAKFFDKASIERQYQSACGFYFYLPIKDFFVKNVGSRTPVFLVDFFQRTVTRWITSIWSSISYFGVFDTDGAGGRNSSIAAAAAAKNK